MKRKTPCPYCDRPSRDGVCGTDACADRLRKQRHEPVGKESIDRADPGGPLLQYGDFDHSTGGGTRVFRSTRLS